LDVSAWWNLGCSVGEHLDECGLDIGDGCCGVEVVGGVDLVVGVKWTFSSSSGKCLSADTLHTGRPDMDFTSAAFHNPVDSAEHFVLEAGEVLHMSLDVSLFEGNSSTFFAI
jgi:hypothetical protein